MSMSMSIDLTTLIDRANKAEEQVNRLTEIVTALEAKLSSTTVTTVTKVTKPILTDDVPHLNQTISSARARELMVKTDLTLDEKFDLMKSIGEECINDDELRTLLATKPNPICYDGFEPSGRMHIAQGLLKAINVNKCVKSGCTFIFWVADWFALMNNKMGGDLNRIRDVGRYMIEVWKACGMDMSGVKFVWCADEINANSNDYWMRVIDISRRFTVPRVKRCSQIMGRNDDDELYTSQMFYPCMQTADIFHLKADICQLGMDQRKVNMLAREYCAITGRKERPIILSHHMLMGLLEGQEKMSKSDPGSAIFMEDSAADVTSKIKKAYCPPGIVKSNPCLDYIKHIVMPLMSEFVIEPHPKYGGERRVYTTYEAFESDYVNGTVHPSDVKPALTIAINTLLQPVRDHFANNNEARELLEKVRSYQVTK